VLGLGSSELLLRGRSRTEPRSRSAAGGLAVEFDLPAAAASTNTALTETALFSSRFGGWSAVRPCWSGIEHRHGPRCLAACTLVLPPIRDTLIEGFSHFVTSMTAPIASGWSGCRVGFAPTGKRRLCSAHTQSRLHAESCRARALIGDASPRTPLCYRISGLVIDGLQPIGGRRDALVASFQLQGKELRVVP
jgi:hypothetical protein